MSGYFWGILGLLVVASTKYLTAVRLRALARRMQRERQDANDLKHVLVEVAEKESELKTETEMLQAKIAALQSVVGDIENSLRTATKADSAS